MLLEGIDVSHARASKRWEPFSWNDGSAHALLPIIEACRVGHGTDGANSRLAGAPAPESGAEQEQAPVDEHGGADDPEDSGPADYELPAWGALDWVTD